VPKGLGPRFLIEAGFIIAVAVVAGVERFRTLVIVFLMVVAWLVVAAVELVLAFSRRRRVGEPATSRPAPAVPAFRPEPVPKPAASVRVLRVDREPEPAPEPVVTLGPSTEPEPETAPEEPAAPEPPKPAPEEPRVVAVPPPLPEPEPESEPAPTVVSLASRMTEPREWNLWDLERLAREQTGGDAARDEERSYLLMYLREFANADGVLPSDFDGIVRESFGDVLDAAYSS